MVKISNFFDLSSLGLQSSQAQLLQDFVTQMQATYSGYQANATNPEYVVAQIFASQFADISNLCAAGSTELFRQYGQKLIGLPMQTGTAAAAVATVTASDTLGHTLAAGTQLTLTLNGVAIGFQTASTLTIGSGSSSGTVTVIGVQSGAAFNGATNPCQLVSQITWVSGVTVAAPASGGADQETDDAYLQRLANTLTTLAPRPITASDFATLAINFVPAAGTDQEEVGRASAIDGFSPGPQTFVCSTSSSSPTVTVTTPPATGVIAFPTATVTGTNMPANATVLASPAPTTTGFTISGNATGTGTSLNLTVNGSTANQRTVTVCITDASGNALNSDTINAVQAYFGNLREEGFVVNVVGPNTATIYLTVTVKASTGYTSSTVQANVQSAILAYLNPQNFGLPQGANVGWVNSTTIFVSRLSSAIQLAPGVDHVVSSSLKFDIVASPSNTSDLTLTGPFPLPITTTTSVPLTAVTVT